MRQVVWLGDTKKNLMEFPVEVMQRIGFQLHLVQSGEIPSDVKPFNGVGSGVFEITVQYDKEAYRCVHAVQLGEYIYILHVFHKKSKQGISTSKQDVDLIKKRYADARSLADDK